MCALRNSKCKARYDAWKGMRCISNELEYSQYLHSYIAICHNETAVAQMGNKNAIFLHRTLADLFAGC